jgi:hypothetical protein
VAAFGELLHLPQACSRDVIPLSIVKMATEQAYIAVPVRPSHHRLSLLRRSYVNAVLMP